MTSTMTPAMHLRRSLSVLTAPLLMAACDTSTAPLSPPEPLSALPRTLSANEQAVIAGSNRFAFGLLREVLHRSRPEANVFISPLSASMALGMTMNGSNGATFDAMRTTLGFSDLTRENVNASYRSLIDLLRGLDSGVDFRIANSIWYREGLDVSPQFVSSSSASFDAAVRALDFSAPASVTTINDWVKTNTGGKIASILDEIPPDIVMYLINAIYFKGSWRSAFDPANTSPKAFTPPSGTAVSVPTMHQTASFPFAETDAVQAVDLAYGRTAYTMMVLLPKPGHEAREVAAALDETSWTALQASMHSAEVELALPRFKIAWGDTLNDPLRALGMAVAFTDQADFSGISPTTALLISEVRQKTFVDVNEEGTEAAAVTSVGMAPTSMPLRVVMQVDKPFIVVIRERLSGTILFVGVIAMPAA